jgi:hypothetical protein
VNHFPGLVKWSVNTVRDYVPLYVLGDKNRLTEEPLGVAVHIGAEFDNNADAVEFEKQVRAILEPSS